MMRPYFQPAAGKMVVKRDDAEEQTEGGIIKPGTTVEYESYWNPWGVVLAIGEPYRLDDGTQVLCEFQPGDRIAFARVGSDLTLTAPDGTQQEIYVLAWNGGFGGLRMTCDGCQTEVRNSQQMGPRCPNPACPTNSMIEAASLGDVLTVTRSKA